MPRYPGDGQCVAVQAEYQGEAFAPIKTLRIAGTGYCAIRIRARGYFYVNAFDEGGGFLSGVPMQQFPYIQEQYFPNIKLNDSGVTVFTLYGRSLGTAPGIYTFYNKEFEVLCKDDPGLFKFMSG